MSDDSETPTMLFRCKPDSLIWIGRVGDSSSICCESGKVYELDQDSKMLHRWRERLESVEGPPQCGPTTLFSEVPEKGAALIAWLMNPVAGGSLDWIVPADFKIQLAEGPPVSVANRPASAKELVEKCIRCLFWVSDHTRNGYHRKGDWDKVESADDAINQLRRFRDWAARELQQRSPNRPSY